MTGDDSGEAAGQRGEPPEPPVGQHFLAALRCCLLRDTLELGRNDASEACVACRPGETGPTACPAKALVFHAARGDGHGARCPKWG